MKIAVNFIETIGEEPVTVDEVKLYCHVDNSDEDELFPVMIKAARQYAEHRTGRQLVLSVFDIVVTEYTESEREKGFELPVIPCSSLVSVEVDGVEVLDNSLFLYTPSAVGREPVFASFKTLDGFPNGDQMVLRVQAGQCTEAEKQWMMVRINNWYEQRATFGIGPNFHEFHHDFVDALLDTTTYYGAF